MFVEMTRRLEQKPDVKNKVEEKKSGRGPIGLSFQNRYYAAPGGGPEDS
jgi:hypothetical protein